MKPISIQGAKHIEAFKLEIIFNDGLIRMVDFDVFLQFTQSSSI